MTIVSSPLAAYGFAFGDGTNQFLFGGPEYRDTTGTLIYGAPGIQVLNVEGLEALPGIRSQDLNRGYADGSFTGRDFLDSRTLIFTLQIMSDSSHSMQYYLGELRKYLTMQRAGTSVLQVYFPGNESPYARGVCRMYGRVRRRSIAVDQNYSYGKAIAVLEFYCPDPRVYDDAIDPVTVSSLSSTARTYNRTYNLTYSVGVPGSTGALTVMNAGSYETWPTFTIAGSTCSGPVLTNNTTGDVLAFPNLSLGASDTLVMDSDLKTVLINGVASRNTMTAGSRWFPLPPGEPQSLSLSTTAGSASCTVAFRNAYI